MADDQLARLRTALAGRYAIGRELGRGGTATVYLAEDLKHERPVALKVLKPELAHALGPERFLREIKITARLSHPHILPLLDSGDADGCLYYVMPYVEGESLRDRLDREKQLPIVDAVQIAREVADALGYAHSHDVIHRDVKPENILLESGHAVVADFGIARAIGVAGGDRLTATGLTVGTPSYMSPEQALGQSDLDGRADLYSLGCVLFETLGGEPPYLGATPQAVIAKRLSEPAPRVGTLRETVPAHVQDCVATVLARAPADRFVTAAAFADALGASDAAVPTGDLAAAPVGSSPAGWRSRRAPWLAAGALALVAAAVAVLRGFGRPASDPAAAEEKTWIVVAEFAGPPADSALTAATRNVVISELNQSEVVGAVPRGRIDSALTLAGKPITTRLDSGVAQEIAFRSSVRPVVVGRIERLGREYSVVVRVIDAASGGTILDARRAADSRDALSRVAEEIAGDVQRGLQEGETSLAVTDPVPRVMTPSLAALRKYRDARVLYRRGEFGAARQLLREALVEDHDFASAYRLLGGSYYNEGAYDSAEYAYREAQRRPQRLTDVQRLELDAWIARAIDTDPEAAVAAYDDLIARQPGYLAARQARAAALIDLGRYEEALDGYRDVAMRSDPEPSQTNLSDQTLALLNLRRLDEAASVVERLVGEAQRSARVELALARYDWTGARNLAGRLRDDPTLTDWTRHALPGVARASASAALGAVMAADRALLEARAALVRSEQTGWMPVVEASRLLLAIAAQRVDAAERPDPHLEDSPDGTAVAAQWAAVRGDAQRALRLLDRIDRRRVSRPEIRAAEAAIAFRARDFGGVTSILGPLVARGRADGVPGTPLSRWLIARAYEELNRADSAAAYYNLVVASPRLDQYGRLLDGVSFAFGQLRLGRLYTQLEQFDRAEEHYLAFLETFTEPDPEYAHLVTEARAALEEVARGRSAVTG